MARYEHIDNQRARDIVTGEILEVIERSVWYVHLHKNILAITIDGLEQHFTPIERLSDVNASDDEFSVRRKLVIKHQQLKSGHTYPVIVAAQVALDEAVYVDCIVDAHP